MVGHDAPGFHQLIDAVVARPEPETDWFARWRATDIYCKQLETRIALASFNNEGLARQCISLLQQVRDLNRELRKLHREREAVRGD